MLLAKISPYVSIIGWCFAADSSEAEDDDENQGGEIR